MYADIEAVELAGLTGCGGVQLTAPL